MNIIHYFYIIGLRIALVSNVPPVVLSKAKVIQEQLKSKAVVS